MLSNFLHSFVGSSHGGIPFRPAPLPALGLSEGDKQCIRDRSSIMARHFFADKNEDFINAQVCCPFSVHGKLMRFLLYFHLSFCSNINPDCFIKTAIVL